MTNLVLETDLDADAASLLAKVAADSVRRPPMPDDPALRLAAARAGYRAIAPLAGPAPEMLRRNVAARGAVPALRVFVPRGAAPKGAIVYVHGGGFTMGDLDSHDVLAARLADAAGLVLVAVDYPRAPEARHPAAVEGVVAAVKAVAGGKVAPVTGPVLLAGDSAGGTLALLAARDMREAGVGVSGLFLAYPNADLSAGRAARWPSVRAHDGKVMRDAELEANLAAYGGAAASPLAVDLAGLPPVAVATAGHDPLRDEGLALVARLQEAGTQVAHWHYPGQIHGFLQLAGPIRDGAALVKRAGTWMAGRAAAGSSESPFSSRASVAR